MAKSNACIPKFEENGDFDHFCRSFKRYTKLVKFSKAEAVELLLLQVPAKLEKFYEQEKTIPRTEEESELDSVLRFFKSKLCLEVNELLETTKLYKTRQNEKESIADFQSRLRTIANNCAFPGDYCDRAVRDAFCVGLRSEQVASSVFRSYGISKKNGKDFLLKDAIEAAEIEICSIEASSVNSDESNRYHIASPNQCVSCCAGNGSMDVVGSSKENMIAVNLGDHKGSGLRSCYRCGFKPFTNSHLGSCKARDVECHKCGRKGHFAKVCRSPAEPLKTAACLAAHTTNTRKTVYMYYKNHRVPFLLDTGSDVTAMRARFAKGLGLTWEPVAAPVVDFSNSSLKVLGIAYAEFYIGKIKLDLKILVCEELCTDCILGADSLSAFNQVNVKYGGHLPDLQVAASGPESLDDFSMNTGRTYGLKLDPVPIIRLFKDTKPIRSPTRYYSDADRDFVRCEIRRLLKEGIIRPSSSSFRSQVVVAKDQSKRRLCVDYAATINKHSEVDAFPVPLMQSLVSQVSKWKFYSTLDLKGAFHQLPLLEEEKHYTAFEANGELFEWNFVPFGIINGTPGFQRALRSQVFKGMDNLAIYVDNITVGGETREEHDNNLREVLARAKEFNLIFNETKCVFNTQKLTFLGHVFEDSTVKPDPERMTALLDHPTPIDSKSMQRLIGMFVFYSKWIEKFAEKITPLIDCMKFHLFPASKEVLDAIETLKRDVANAQLYVPDPNYDLLLETDASGVAISGVLSQNNRPIAFVSHKLSSSEKHWSTVEREAFAIVHSVEKLRPFLLGRHFQLLTDQQSVAYIFNGNHKSQIKNSKITRWKLDLAEYNFEIRYRPGELNQQADCLSRIAALQGDIEHQKSVIFETHAKLGHPGIQRTFLFLKQYYSWTDLLKTVKSVLRDCPICASEKPLFPKKLPEGKLISSTQPWQRLSIDFVGPKPSVNHNRYILTCVDEFSRYPFAFAVADTSTKTVVGCLQSLFLLFGPPDSVHTDRGAQFESKDFSEFLEAWKVHKTRTTPYHSKGNGQCERFNGIIVNTLRLRCKNENKDFKYWTEELPFALANIRSLVCNATGDTPHDRFFKFNRKSPLTPHSRDTSDCEIDSVVLNDLCKLPDWVKPGSKVKVRNHVRKKDDPKLNEEIYKIESILSPYVVELSDNNGVVNTVSIRDVAFVPLSDPPNTVNVDTVIERCTRSGREF